MLTVVQPPRISRESRTPMRGVFRSRGSAVALIIALVVCGIDLSVWAYVGPILKIATGPAKTRQAPAVSYNPSLGEFLVVWQEASPASGAIQVYGQVLDKDGSSSGIEFLIGNEGYQNLRPQVACAGRNQWVVAWESHDAAWNSSTIWACTVSPAGATSGYRCIDSDWRVEARPDIGGSRTTGNYLIVWEEENFGNIAYAIRGRFYSAATGPEGPEFTIGWSIINDAMHPSVNHEAGSDYFVSWERRYSSDNVAIEGRAILRSLQGGYDLGPVLTLAYDQTRDGDPAVASNGSDGGFTVVFRHLSAGDLYEIQYIVTDGSRVIGQGGIPGSLGIVGKPTIAPDGVYHEFLVCFAAGSSEADTWRVEAATLDVLPNAAGSGTVLTEVVNHSGAPQAAVAGAGPGHALLAWDGGPQAASLQGRKWSARTPVPQKPSRLTANTASSTQIHLSWTDHSTDESGFRIERRTSGRNFREIASVPPNTTSYLDQGLGSNTVYCYRVYAYNSAGISPYSNEACARTASTSNEPRKNASPPPVFSPG